jgi:hypothetical protein
MPTAEARASTILAEFDQAQAELVGKAVILTDGKAGTVDSIWLDEAHGLRISIRADPTISGKVICPTGELDEFCVNPCAQKYSSFVFTETML